ncbi:MAG: polysaccharide pyruvyl transferase family protein [Bacteroidales bacterium]|nr:polysaccharide pyruvyl transferase family protein [Bacteroidales bacterium]
MKVVMYPHGGSGNHGCEAIVRSTLKILEADGVLFSSNMNEDFQYGLDSVCKIEAEKKHMSYKHLSYWKSLILYHLKRDYDAFDKAIFDGIIREASCSDYALSIGGDNYCYGVPKFIYLINSMLHKKAVRTILWGCSIEPKSIDSSMLEDLKLYYQIYARESITYNTLRRYNLKNVFYYPDPAFVLDPTKVILPNNFVKYNTIGINISPLIIEKENTKGVVQANYTRLIDFVVNQTNLQVALIPHVVWKHNNDLNPLGEIYEKYKDTGRVLLIPDCTAGQLKYVISQCRFLITARTHASIAAYSTKVPTIVIGYSVKAEGIAKDIFGTTEHYVLPVDVLTADDILLKEFIYLMQHEDSIRQYYDRVMPEYIGLWNKFRGLD